MKPTRMCVACRQRFFKQDLIRLSKSNQTVEIDYNKKNDSRAIYVCKNDDCINKLKKTKAILRIFSVDVDEKFYENLKNSI